MAQYYETFSSIPANRLARGKLMRAARLGSRPAPVQVDYGDALRTVDASRAYKAGWTTSVDPFPLTVRSAWAAR